MLKELLMQEFGRISTCCLARKLLAEARGGGFNRLRAFCRAKVLGKWFVGLWGCG